MMDMKDVALWEFNDSENYRSLEWDWHVLARAGACGLLLLRVIMISPSSSFFVYPAWLLDFEGMLFGVSGLI